MMTHHLKRACTLAALAVGLGFAGAAHAQSDTPAERRAAAEALQQQMDQVLGTDKIMAMIRGSVQGPIEQLLKSSVHLTPQQRNRAGALLGEAIAVATEEMIKDWMPRMQASITDLYVERFTAAEIRDVQRFYESAAGRKSITVMQEDLPRLMAPLMQAMQTRPNAMTQRVESALRQLAREGIQVRSPGQ